MITYHSTVFQHKHQIHSVCPHIINIVIKTSIHTQIHSHPGAPYIASQTHPCLFYFITMFLLCVVESLFSFVHLFQFVTEYIINMNIDSRVHSSDWLVFRSVFFYGLTKPTPSLHSSSSWLPPSLLFFFLTSSPCLFCHMENNNNIYI